MATFYKTIRVKCYVIFLLALINGVVIADDFDDEQYYLNGTCVSVRGGLRESGICKLIDSCPVVLAQMIKRNDSYTICEYEDFRQVVCCPLELNIPTNTRLRLRESVDCTVDGTSDTGVIKYKSDCKDFKENSNLPPQQICSYDICKDLICCPTKQSTRLKQVCSHVDMPSNTVTLRLHLNQPCIVKNTNLTGQYQQKCDYATRNPHMRNALQDVCNDDSCNGWYCCPIEEPGDNYYCDDKIPLPNVIKVGPTCTDSKTGQSGRCRSIDNCRGFEVNRLDKCGKHCCLDYYCCPNIQPNISHPIADEKCAEFSNFVYKHEVEVQMNTQVKRIICSPEVLPVGGEIVEPGEYPHMAALGYESNGDVTWSCGGSLISDEYVLTAAHCLLGKIGELKKVRLGVIDLYNDIETPDCPEDYLVLKSIPHPQHNRSLVYNDIGLIQLNRKVQFNYHIRPICLPSTSNYPTRFESMGWGDMGPHGNKTEKLIKVRQDLYSHDECQKYFANQVNRRFDSRGVAKDIQMCAGSIHDVQGTCTGDSGGPLLAKHSTMNQMFVIYGIVSTGTVCGFPNTPGIFTQVYPYRDWIEGIVFGGRS